MPSSARLKELPTASFNPKDVDQRRQHNATRLFLSNRIRNPKMSLWFAHLFRGASPKLSFGFPIEDQRDRWSERSGRGKVHEESLAVSRHGVLLLAGSNMEYTPRGVDRKQSHGQSGVQLVI